MSLQILPNKFKIVGLFTFFIFCGIPSIISFFMGFTQPFESNENSPFLHELLNPTIMKYANILTILGMLVYMLSKEKVEDDYITKLRLESYQLATIICLAITFILHLINAEMMFNLSYPLYIFIIIFLIIFYFKKRQLH
ncbi:hypothetical protein [Maribacter dokdonensis]|uniref:hypothetical protein n=1 Tax=Maribacter dokdonensis TaxID=320912 RepID=UPI0032984447